MPNYSGLWNGVYAVDHSLLTPSQALGNPLKELAIPYVSRNYGRGALGKLLEKLLGTAPGATATKQHKRVQSAVVLDSPSQGGSVAIETYSDVNRVTTAADVTAITRAFAYVSKPTYPIEASGNGGGGKLGF